MTNGIIQEIFDKHLSDKKIHLGDYLLCKRIQQELIEKIKQIPIQDYFYHYKPNHWSCSSKCNLDIIKTLIGDNQ